MGILSIIVSVVLILFGRKFFWFFAGAAGFVVGISLTAQIFQGRSDWMVLIAAILSGILMSLLAVLYRRLAVFMAGFFAGAYVLVNLVRLVNIPGGEWNWLLVLAGGILGAIWIGRAFDWAVILLSIFTGTLMIIQTLNFPAAITALLLVSFILVGIYFQNRALKQELLRGLR